MPNAKQIAEEMRKQEMPEAPGVADFARRMKQILDNVKEKTNDKTT